MENNLFDRSRSIFQVVLTRLTPVNKTWLSLKPTDFVKNRLPAFHSFLKRKVFHMRETLKSLDDLDSFLSLPTEDCCQPTVANCCKVFDARPETCNHCESMLV